jgi:integrase/recombinase XerC
MKCQCPVWCDGEIDEKRVRQSLDTRDWARAGRKLAILEDRLNATAEGQAEPEDKRKSVSDATNTFIALHDVEPSTMRKYRRIMDRLTEFANLHRIAFIDEFTLEDLGEYKLTRQLCALSWQKELQLLRTFFEFCLDRDWIEKNPAKKMKMPSDPKPKPRQPYSSNDIIQILFACDTFGKANYERLRAKAMVLLLRFYGLRISDVATLRKDRIKEDHIFLHALKNGASLWLPLYPEVKHALGCLPLPHGASADCEYFFWTGGGSREEHIKTVARTLKAVFRAGRVRDAHAHHFRHTLATEILIAGGTIQDCANILGDSPQIIRKPCAKWPPEYQRRTVDIMSRVHRTYTAHENIGRVSPVNTGDRVVPGVGLEPTLPLPEKGF